MRVDLAGNISKKFGTAGIRFPRFSGLCTLWNVAGAFLQPGRIRTQISRMPDGNTVFAIACTMQRYPGGYHAPQVLHAIGIGCELAMARRTVYADGMDLDNTAAAVPIGITCRSCERVACQARAFPALGRPLKLDENVRGPSFYAPVDAAAGRSTTCRDTWDSQTWVEKPHATDCRGSVGARWAPSVGSRTTQELRG